MRLWPLRWQKHWRAICLGCTLAAMATMEPSRAWAEDAPDWTPALLVQQSPFLRFVNFQPSDEVGGAPATPPSTTPNGSGPSSYLDDFAIETKKDSKLTLPGSQDATVTSLTLTDSTVGKSPAAVFVINQEMIRRSGAQSLPEILRMVPGVHVGVGNGITPNVSIRGFGAGGNTPFSSRVLVLIDGRSIYEPLFGGVIWQTNDLVIQDIERIEVIRGPGATIWGANAVNGVINVITKSAADTQGLMVSSLGGSELQNITVARHGSKVGEDAYLRVYGKFKDVDDQLRDPEDAARSLAFRGEPANDGFHDFMGGFRYDKALDDATDWSVQGRISAAPGGDAVTTPVLNVLVNPNPASSFVGSVQSRMTHAFDDDSELTLLAIYDRADNAVSFGQYHRDSYVLDAAYRWSVGERHKLVAGGQFRLDRDTLVPLDYPGFEVALDPASQTYNVVSWLLQDEIQLVPDDLTLLVGTKMEVNPFTGFEIQPSARLLKTLDEQRVVWAAVSRAIRRPNRIEEHSDITGRIPGFGNLGTIFNVQGNADLKSDSLVAMETGYRAEPTEWLTWDITGFYNIYSDLTQYVVNADGLDIIATNTNTASAESYGAELSGTVEMTDTWSVTGAYSYLAIFAHAEAQEFNFVTKGFERLYEGTAPNNILYLRNSWSPSEDWDLDLIHRYVDQVAFGKIPPYVEMDVRLAWRPKKHLELAVVGQNLLDSAHAEFGTAELVPFNALRTQVQRSVYGSITYQY